MKIIKQIKDQVKEIERRHIGRKGRNKGKKWIQNVGRQEGNARKNKTWKEVKKKWKKKMEKLFKDTCEENKLYLRKKLKEFAKE